MCIIMLFDVNDKLSTTTPYFFNSIISFNQIKRHKIHEKQEIHNALTLRVLQSYLHAIIKNIYFLSKNQKHTEHEWKICLKHTVVTSILTK